MGRGSWEPAFSKQVEGLVADLVKGLRVGMVGQQRLPAPHTHIPGVFQLQDLFIAPLVSVLSWCLTRLLPSSCTVLSENPQGPPFTLRDILP